MRDFMLGGCNGDAGSCAFLAGCSYTGQRPVVVLARWVVCTRPFNQTSASSSIPAWHGRREPSRMEEARACCVCCFYVCAKMSVLVHFQKKKNRKCDGIIVGWLFVVVGSKFLGRQVNNETQERSWQQFNDYLSNSLLNMIFIPFYARIKIQTINKKYTDNISHHLYQTSDIAWTRCSSY